MLSISFRRLAGSNLLAQSAEQLSLAAVPIVAVLLLFALVVSEQVTIGALAVIGFMAAVVFSCAAFGSLSVPLCRRATPCWSWKIAPSGGGGGSNLLRPIVFTSIAWVGVTWPVSVSLWLVVAGLTVQAILITASKVRTLKRLPDPLPD